MARRLRVMKAKRRKDQATAVKNGTAPAAHKVAVERSEKAKLKKNNRSV